MLDDSREPSLGTLPRVDTARSPTPTTSPDVSPPAIAQPSSSPLTKYAVRELLSEILRSDSDLDAFCIDFFGEVYACFSNGMDRIAKVNRLIIEVPLVHIVDALRTKAPSRFT